MLPDESAGIDAPLEPPPGVTLRISPDYRKFDRALRTQVRPVLVPLQRLPFRDFAAEEFIGGHVLTCGGPGGCRSVFQGSALTLGHMADALLYVGGGETDVKPLDRGATGDIGKHVRPEGVRDRLETAGLAVAPRRTVV